MLIPALQEVDPVLRDQVHAELRAGEQIVWAGQPVPRFLSAAIIGPMLFAIPWTAFAIFWETSAIQGTRSNTHGDRPGSFIRWLFPLWGIPFILIGLGMFTTPIWVRRRMRKTVYAVTNQRAIIFEPGFWGTRKTQSFDPPRLAAIERVERGDGSGDLIFEQFTTRKGSGQQTVRLGFMGISRVRDVEDILRKTLLKGQTRAI